jgi:hypothetical protein
MRLTSPTRITTTITPANAPMPAPSPTAKKRIRPIATAMANPFR